MRSIVRANLQRAAFLAALFFLAPYLSPAARLSEGANRAFNSYIAGVEARLARQHTRADTCFALPAGERDGGAVRVEPVNGGTWPVTGGLLHHWRASAVVRGATAEDMLALVRDYNHLDRYYAPDVVSSRLLADRGQTATLVMRFRKRLAITIVMDAEFETESALNGRGGYSFSHSTHVWEVDSPGTPHERRRPEGHDDGFLWRLNSYWSFAETPEGLRIECEAVSLTRDVPTGLGWLIRPIIETLPRQSLEFTFTATRNALMANAARRHNDEPSN